MPAVAANPPHPPSADRYHLVEVTGPALSAAVRPRQFIHIDQSECISCEGCVDICPWKCLWLLSPDAVADADGVEVPGQDPADASVFVIDEDACTRCGLCVDRCPTGVITLGTLVDPPAHGDPHQRSARPAGSTYGMRV